MPQPRQIKQPRPFTKAHIRFLQRDDIGIDLADHIDRASRIETTIDTDAFVHVVGGKQQAARRPVIRLQLGRTIMPVPDRGKHGAGNIGIGLLHAKLFRRMFFLQIGRRQPDDTVEQPNQEWPLPQRLELDGLGMVKRVQNALVHRLGKGGIINLHIHLEVKP